MKKYFLTGIVILLPLALTIAVVTFLVNLFTAPFMGVVQPILSQFEFFKTEFLFLKPEQIIQYCSQLTILLCLFFFCVMLGVLTRWVIIHYFINIGEYILHRIPLINSIYKTSQDVINTIFTKDSTSFKQVALVPFPNEKTLAIGLVTREKIAHPTDSKDLVAVFVPTTPNPTSGFLVMFKQEEVTYLDMSVEEAFKYIISCGVIAPPFQPRPSKEKKAIEGEAQSD